MRNIVPAIGLFILLTWLELGYHVTSFLMATAYLGRDLVPVAQDHAPGHVHARDAHVSVPASVPVQFNNSGSDPELLN